MTVMSHQVLIIGAGVGGLTLGRALSRLGVAVQVFDCRRSSEMRLDRGLGLWDQSQVCLRELGLVDMLEKHAHYIPPAAYRSTKGQWLSRASAAPQNRRRVACIEQNRLLAALGDKLDILQGKKLVNIQEVGDSVRAQFEDGSTAEGCALIGADGVTSTVRNLLFPDSILQHAGEICFSGFNTANHDAPDVSSSAAAGEPFETIGTGRHGPIRMAVIPIGARRHFWFATVSVPPRRPGAGLPDPAGWEADFAGWHDPIPSILDSAAAPGGDAQRTSAAPLLREDIYSLQRPLRRWSRGRCALLGDACHVIGPNLAQGAAVAIEDAAALAPRLAAAVGGAAAGGAAAGGAATGGGVRGGGGGAVTAAGGIAAALGSYEASRRRRVEACRRVTEFTRLLCRYPGAAGLMRYVPAAVNGHVFDALLNHSLAAR